MKLYLIEIIHASGRLVEQRKVYAEFHDEALDKARQMWGGDFSDINYSFAAALLSDIPQPFDTL